MALSPGTVLQNRYRIAKLVGQGGFGAVYRGWDMALEQPVAVKENFDSGPEPRVEATGLFNNGPSRGLKRSATCSKAGLGRRC